MFVVSGRALVGDSGGATADDAGAMLLYVLFLLFGWCPSSAVRVATSIVQYWSGTKLVVFHGQLLPDETSQQAKGMRPLSCDGYLYCAVFACSLPEFGLAARTRSVLVRKSL